MIPVECRENVVPLPEKAPYPRVCIFTSFNENYAPIVRLVRRNWKAYCELHGYALRFYPDMYHEDPSRPETYGDKGKFELYYDVRGHCDFAMWLDIDSIFTNINTPIQIANFLWTYDDNGPLSGLWIAGTDSTTEKHLRYAYARAATQNNIRHGRIEPNGISDQDSMRDLMNIPPFKETFGNCVPAKQFGHCYPENWEPGDWIFTVPGRPVEEKVSILKEYLDKSAEAHRVRV